MTREEYFKAVFKLRKWAKAYYHEDNPIATDEEYDTLYRGVSRYEEEYGIINKESPTQFVGWKE